MERPASGLTPSLSRRARRIRSGIQAGSFESTCHSERSEESVGCEAIPVSSRTGTVQKLISSCLLICLLAGCQHIEISDLSSPAAGNFLKARQKIPFNAGIRHLRDQGALSDSESSVAVTLYFADILNKAGLFDRIIYPASDSSGADIELYIDFEKKFHYHYLANEGKNLLLIVSVFLLYPWLRVRVDYEIRGRLELTKAGKVLKTYEEQGASSLYLTFFASYNQAADMLAGRSMQLVSERLIARLIGDQDYFLGLAFV